MVRGYACLEMHDSLWVNSLQVTQRFDMFTFKAAACRCCLLFDLLNVAGFTD
jgi:hypothetical protein